MKTRKTPQNLRDTYKHFDDDGNLIAEYKPGKDGVTEEGIKLMHKMDDHDVYINRKEYRHSEWFQPIYDEWKKKYIEDFKAQYGYAPNEEDIPGRYRQYVSIDAQGDEEEDYDDCSSLELEMAVYDRDDTQDAASCAWEIVLTMPVQWQKVYKLVFKLGMNKTKAAEAIGISDVRVGQITRNITARLAADKNLQKFYR